MESPWSHSKWGEYSSCLLWISKLQRFKLRCDDTWRYSVEKSFKRKSLVIGYPPDRSAEKQELYITLCCLLIQHPALYVNDYELCLYMWHLRAVCTYSIYHRHIICYMQAQIKTNHHINTQNINCIQWHTAAAFISAQSHKQLSFSCFHTQRQWEYNIRIKLYWRIKHLLLICLRVPV